MELKLVRGYFPKGTNGNLWNGDKLICHSIELPWKDNKRNISCIPEGRYLIIPRVTEERSLHFMLADVPDRSHILFHPANNALKELQGCIAPVTRLTGPGKGLESRKASEHFKFILKCAWEQGEEIFITITSIAHANNKI